MKYPSSPNNPLSTQNYHLSLSQIFLPISSSITNQNHQPPPMAAVPRITSHRLISLSHRIPKPISKHLHFQPTLNPIFSFGPFDPNPNPNKRVGPHVWVPRREKTSSSSSKLSVRAGWLLGLGGNNKNKKNVSDLVKAGDPVLHEPAREVDPNDIGSDRLQMIIDDMISVMRLAPGVGLAAPQIGFPLKIIVLEDTKEYISYAPKEEIKAQDRRPFDLLVIINPKLKKKSDKTALFFEGCLSVDGYRAVVERYLDVEVSGLDRYGQPIKVNASGWQARILQHECDHLEGSLYVDKMVPRTFRTVENLDLPLAGGIPKLGPC